MKWPAQNFWCTTDKEISSLVRLLTPVFGLEQISEDAENVWEWAEGRDSDGRYWNLSRKSRSGRARGEEILRIVVDPVPSDPADFARSLVALIGAATSFGVVTYLNGDEFLFREEFSVEP